MQAIKTFLEQDQYLKNSNPKERIIAHIDMNSYFATVEQQANPRLRGKPIGVSGKFIPENLKRSVIAAASVEAKARGVKTAMPLWEARRICPDLLVIPGDPDKYETVTKKFLKIFERHTPEIEIFSIDEAFLDLTETPLNPPLLRGEIGGSDGKYELAEKIALRIKAAIRQEIGEWLSCSIGIGPNKMIAKLSSDQQKPNGLVVTRPRDVEKLLAKVELTDICGIASRLERRLHNLGIKKPLEMGRASEKLLKSEFGSWGKMFKLWGQGLDPSPIVPYYLGNAPKSMGHSYTLPRNTNDWLEVKKYLYLMANKVGRRLRREAYAGRSLSVLLRTADFHHLWQVKKFKDFFNDSFVIYDLALRIIKSWHFKGSVRLVGVSVGELTEMKNLTPSLIPKDKKILKVLKAQDKINDKFGELTITRGAFFKTKLRTQVGGFFEKEKLSL